MEICVSSYPAFLTSQNISMQYATMPHNLIFAGIDLLLPDYACIKSGCTENLMNERGIFSVDVNKGLTTRSGASLRTDDGKLQSVNDKMGVVRFTMLSHMDVGNNRVKEWHIG